MTIDEEGPQCICGNRGCLEAMVSDKALVRQAVERLAESPRSMVLQLAQGDESKITREIIVEAAKAGDEMAQALIWQAGTHIGTGLANLVNILNPEAIIVGGEAAAQAGDLLLLPARLVIHDLDSEDGAAIAVEESPAELARFQEDMCRWVDGIRSGRFSALGDAACRTCDYAGVC